MPELPEVESVVSSLKAASLIGKTLSSVQIICPKIPSELSQLIEHRIEGIERRGKYIHFRFSSGIHLIIHLRMTGQFLLKAKKASAAKHERVIFNFKEGIALAFHDTRRFATFDLTRDPDAIFSKLGPEPLDPAFSAEQFFSSISQKSKAIKASLLDQGIIAGVGNIYADEALWDAKIHPERPSSDLSKKESEQLLKSIQKVLRNGIQNGGTSLGSGSPNFHHLNGQSGNNQNTLNVYGKEGESCARCGRSIEKIAVKQRGTHFCPICQKP